MYDPYLCLLFSSSVWSVSLFKLAAFEVFLNHSILAIVSPATVSRNTETPKNNRIQMFQQA